jgi:hypothetical protein
VSVPNRALRENLPAVQVKRRHTVVLGSRVVRGGLRLGNKVSYFDNVMDGNRTAHVFGGVILGRNLWPERVLVS